MKQEYGFDLSELQQIHLRSSQSKSSGKFLIFYKVVFKTLLFKSPLQNLFFKLTEGFFVSSFAIDRRPCLSTVTFDKEPSF